AAANSRPGRRYLGEPVIVNTSRKGSNKRSARRKAARKRTMLPEPPGAVKPPPGAFSPRGVGFLTPVGRHRRDALDPPKALLVAAFSRIWRSLRTGMPARSGGEEADGDVVLGLRLR